MQHSVKHLYETVDESNNINVAKFECGNIFTDGR